MQIRITLQATDDEARANLARLVRERGDDLPDISRLIDRPAGYLSQYVRGKGPRRLAEGDARDLARYFRVEPQLFGVPLDEVPARPVLGLRELNRRAG